MSEHHISIAAAKRAVRTSLPTAHDDNIRAQVLSALHHTISVEALQMDASFLAVADALARASAVLIATRCSDPDGARALMKNVWSLATSQLEILLALPVGERTAASANAPNNQGSEP